MRPWRFEELEICVRSTGEYITLVRYASESVTWSGTAGEAWATPASLGSVDGGRGWAFFVLNKVGSLHSLVAWKE